MKPKNTDSNLYNYHLKLLLKENLVEKNDKGYRLSPLGLRFIDHISTSTFEPRWQPKILTKIVVIKDDQILLWPKMKQPFITKWSLPSGKMHYDDFSLESAALREISYMTDKQPRNVVNRGVIEFNAYIHDVLVTHTIAHVFTADLDSIVHSTAKFVPFSELDNVEFSPATRETIQAVQENDTYFYKHFDIAW